MDGYLVSSIATFEHHNDSTIKITIMKQIYNLIKKTKSLIYGIWDIFKNRSKNLQSTCSLKHEFQVSYDDVPFSIKVLVDTFVKDFTPLAKIKGLIFAGIYNGEDITVLGNQKYISSLINNLLANAIKCTSNGYVILNLEYVNRKLIICVADSGIGLSESQMREFNLSEMRFGNTELSKSLGRDLTDTLGIVNKLRGSIKVFSDAEKGCKFIVQLPLPIYTRIGSK